MEMNPREQLIKKYFMIGLQHKEILEFLQSIHNIVIHPRTLKGILKKHNLYRRIHFSNLEEIVTFIEDQLKKSGKLHGYRWMHLKCIHHGFTVTQEIIRELLLLLDPEGVNLRKRKRLRRRQYINNGPNSVWHMDSYDKLKPYGICINGAIDGFSRNIIWLYAGRTSSDPKVIAGYYSISVKSLGGCPRTAELDEVTLEWNSHKIISTKNCRTPVGRPLTMFQVPSLYNTENKLVRVPQVFLDCLDDECAFNGTHCNSDVEELCLQIILENGLKTQCNDAYDGVALYLNLRGNIYNVLDITF